MVIELNSSTEHGAHMWSNPRFRFVKGIWLYRYSRQNRFFWETTYLTSYVHDMFWATILYMPLTHGAVSNSFPLKDLYRQVSQKSYHISWLTQYSTTCAEPQIIIRRFFESIALLGWIRIQIYTQWLTHPQNEFAKCNEKPWTDKKKRDCSLLAHLIWATILYTLMVAGGHIVWKMYLDRTLQRWNICFNNNSQFWKQILNDIEFEAIWNRRVN